MSLEQVMRLERDMIKGILSLKSRPNEDIPYREMRFLVDAYYTMQEYRKATANQVSAMDKSGEPHEIIDWLLTQVDTMEKQVKRALSVYAPVTVPGRWMLAQRGVGPVISAGMLAHLDVTRSETAGGFWKFAGLDPDVVWEKGKKRPWNAELKVVCWNLGESFVKVSKDSRAFYGQLYQKRKEAEVSKNERGEFADQAAAKLEKFRIGKNTKAYAAYAAGRLPPKHIHARAKRYAVKMFLSHLHHVMYEDHYGKPPPKPFAVEHLGHAHTIAPPLWPLGEEAA